MNKLVDLTFNNKKVHYIIIQGHPWFKGNDIASILGYTRPRKAIMDHVPDKYKNTLQDLIADARGSPTAVLPDDNPIVHVSNHNDKFSVFINEPGIYRLIFSSKAPLADSFTDWVVSEVLPSIRQTGSYMTKDAAIEKWGLIDNDESKAKLIVNNPTGERALHYDIVKYIRKTYPNVILTSSLGENQITHLTRLDSYHKGYQRGTPDLELKCKVGDSVDVVAIELKFGSNVLSIEQEDYLDKLNKINITTFVAYRYEDIVIFLHEHYKRIKETKHKSPNRIDFSTNRNPIFWIQRLMNKNNILQQAEYRNLDVNNLWKLPNREIVSILINYDKNGS